LELAADEETWILTRVTSCSLDMTTRGIPVVVYNILITTFMNKRL
jgi:hypothetical protein